LPIFQPHSLAQETFDMVQGLTAQLLELFTLGTTNILAPLTGINARFKTILIIKSELTGVCGINALC
jgi:hypothetical protein